MQPWAYLLAAVITGAFALLAALIGRGRKRPQSNFSPAGKQAFSVHYHEAPARQRSGIMVLLGLVLAAAAIILAIVAAVKFGGTSTAAADHRGLLTTSASPTGASQSSRSRAAVNSVTTPPSSTNAITFDSAQQALVKYFRTAGARNYPTAWTLLTAKYQGRYGSYSAFEKFWGTVRDVGIYRYSTSFEGVSSDRTELTLTAFYDLKSGHRSNELIRVIFVLGPGQEILIDDYRVLREIR